jgi:hypothetical protein
MNHTIILEEKAIDGKLLRAEFIPEKGMNMISYKKGEIEIIDQSTSNLFEERYAGLGALIGPHFHRRRAESVPKIKDESLFPHIARVKAKGVQDPFSHGIARYAPWKAEKKGNQLKAIITGKDLWNGVPLSELEGQNFKMEFSAELKPNGLFLQLSIVSDTDSLIGIHYYYRLPNNQGKVISEVENKMRNSKGELQTIPPEWSFDTQHRLVFDLKQEADYNFRTYPDPLQGHIILETEEYSLLTKYQCKCEENSWQLYHPAGTSFVCIEPLSSQDPRHPNLSVSSLNIQLEIL